MEQLSIKGQGWRKRQSLKRWHRWPGWLLGKVRKSFSPWQRGAGQPLSAGSRAQGALQNQLPFPSARSQLNTVHAHCPTLKGLFVSALATPHPPPAARAPAVSEGHRSAAPLLPPSPRCPGWGALPSLPGAMPSRISSW